PQGRCLAHIVAHAVLVTKVAARHRARAASADTPSGTPHTSAPANQSITAPRTHRNRNIAAPPPGCPHQPMGRPGQRTPHFGSFVSKKDQLLGALDRGAAETCSSTVAAPIGTRTWNDAVGTVKSVPPESVLSTRPLSTTRLWDLSREESNPP